jgi:hypothetical protein
MTKIKKTEKINMVGNTATLNSKSADEVLEFADLEIRVAVLPTMFIFSVFLIFVMI